LNVNHNSGDDSILVSLWKNIGTSGNQSLYNQVKLHIEMLENHGLEMNKHFKSDSLERLEEDLYELRLRIARVLFSVDEEGIRWFLTLFKKESSETPSNEKDRVRDIKEE